jgi:hypothetical protein
VLDSTPENPLQDAVRGALAYVDGARELLPRAISESRRLAIFLPLSMLVEEAGWFILAIVVGGPTLAVWALTDLSLGTSLAVWSALAGVIWIVTASRFYETFTKTAGHSFTLMCDEIEHAERFLYEVNQLNAPSESPPKLPNPKGESFATTDRELNELKTWLMCVGTS